MPDDTPQSVRAVARFIRVSPQKARLVVDLIRGLKAEDALNRLRFTPKRIAGEVAKLLQSALANAADRDLGLDVDALYVTRAFVNDGPRQKRIRPAPMGRAYRYQRRSSHIEVHLGAKPGAASLARHVEASAPAAPAAKSKPAARPARAKAKTKPAAPRAAQRSRGPAKSKPAARPARPKGGSKNKGGE